MTAYITGTSTWKVDDLVRALGRDSGVSRSTVSRICAGIDGEGHTLTSATPRDAILEPSSTTPTVWMAGSDRP